LPGDRSDVFSEKSLETFGEYTFDLVFIVAFLLFINIDLFPTLD
jgi:hypothetical protein